MKFQITPQALFVKFVLPLAVLLAVLACRGSAIAQPTPTPLPTNTSTPEPTSTPKPTKTPLPTATEVPPTPTPAPVGEVVQDDRYAVSVVKVRKLETVYLNNTYQWVANPGFAFLELGVKVENKQSSMAEVNWKNINILDANNDYWYPGWVGAKAVESGVEINPASIVFAPIEDMSQQDEGELAKEAFAFNETVYLRLIYGVEKTEPETIVFFSFDDSPFIEVTLP